MEGGGRCLMGVSRCVTTMGQVRIYRLAGLPRGLNRIHNFIDEVSLPTLNITR